MYIGILRTYYEIYATGETKAETQERVVDGYKACYPPSERQFESPSFDELNNYFGCMIVEIDPQKGYAHE
jgi:hypothetical protein